MSPTSSTTTTSQRPLQSSSRRPPATAGPQICMTWSSTTINFFMERMKRQRQQKTLICTHTHILSKCPIRKHWHTWHFSFLNWSARDITKRNKLFDNRLAKFISNHTFTAQMDLEHCITMQTQDPDFASDLKNWEQHLEEFCLISGAALSSQLDGFEKQRGLNPTTTPKGKLFRLAPKCVLMEFRRWKGRMSWCHLPWAISRPRKQEQHINPKKSQRLQTSTKNGSKQLSNGMNCVHPSAHTKSTTHAQMETASADCGLAKKGSNGESNSP